MKKASEAKVQALKIRYANRDKAIAKMREHTERLVEEAIAKGAIATVIPAVNVDGSWEVFQSELLDHGYVVGPVKWLETGDGRSIADAKILWDTPTNLVQRGVTP